MARFEQTRDFEAPRGTRMKIFISWSKARSKALALALAKWLSLVFEDIEPWVSDRDLQSGARWGGEMARQLQEANFGIVCLTPESLESTWIHFEAGALSKLASESHLIPYYFGVKETDVVGPLFHFQGVEADREGTLKLIRSIEKVYAKESPDGQLSYKFDVLWPTLEEAMKAIPNAVESRKPIRANEDLLEEILTLVRQQRRTVGPRGPRLPQTLHVGPLHAKLYVSGESLGEHVAMLSQEYDNSYFTHGFIVVPQELALRVMGADGFATLGFGDPPRFHIVRVSVMKRNNNECYALHFNHEGDLVSPE